MLSLLFGGNFNIVNAIAYFLSSCVVIFLTLPIHEFAHAFVAYKLGDNTAKYQGRLTINPFAHIDYLGALLIILFGFGWAKPVEVNSDNFKKPKLHMALVALAGPVSNLLVAFVLSLLCGFLQLFAVYPAVSTLIGILWVLIIYIVQINITLAVFNLIPIPPLDGSRLLFALLPDKIYYKVMKYEQILMIIVIALCYVGAFSDLLDTVTVNICNAFLTFALKLFGF